MQKTSQKLPGRIFRIDYTFDYKEIQPEVSRLLSRMRIPGFRPGHVPIAVVDSMYGKNAAYLQIFTEKVGDDWKKEAEEAGVSVFDLGEVTMEPVKRNEPFVFHYDLLLTPSLELGDYKDVKVLAPKTEVTEDMVESAIRQELVKQISRSNVTDRPCKDGDVVIVDYVGTIDGEAFDGGSADGATIKLGAGNYLEDLETGIVGMAIGEERDCTVHFPADYIEESLQGKTANFHVTLKSITEETIPELDDDFVQDVSEFDTVDEYRASIRKRLEEQFAQSDKEELHNRILNAILEKSNLEIGDHTLYYQAEAMLNDQIRMYSRQGFDYEKMLESNGVKKEDLIQANIPSALQRVSYYLLTQELIKSENIEVSDEELNTYLENLREALGDRYEEFIAGLNDERRNEFRIEAQLDKLFDVLAGYAEITYVPHDDPRLQEQPKAESESAEASAEASESAEAPAESTEAPKED